jgi:exonuclease SbcC
MRLHRLQLAAFGPFAGRIEVDLDELGTDGLFLLHGETGAGKTTLLDAVAYALYGRVPGARGEAKRLRSDLARADIPTEVTLEFSVAGRRLVITRRAEYERAKSRGTGVTKVKPAVSLRFLDCGPVDGLSRADEIGQVVLDLVGMSADQFFQVVLLPQGEFARFLRADTAERETLLEKLFDTGRYRAIEEFLAAGRRDATVAAAAARSEMDRQLSRLCEAAGLEEVPADVDEPGLAALESALADAASAAAARAELTRTSAAAAREALAEKEARDGASARLLDLRAEEVEIDALTPAHDRLVAVLEASRRAAPVALADRLAIGAAEGEAVASRRCSTSRRAVPVGMQPELGAVGSHELDAEAGLFSLDEDGAPFVPLADGQVIRDAAARFRERAGQLRSLLEEATAQREDEEQAEQARAAVIAHDAELSRIAQELAGLPDRLANAVASLDEARTAAGRLPDLVASADGAAAVHEAAVLAARLDDEIGGAHGAVLEAVELHQAAVDGRQELVERRFADMAGELAASLTDGCGCPVCGSVDHPEPAGRREAPVSAEALDSAHADEESLAKTRTAAERELNRLRADRAAAAATSRGRAPRDAEAAWLALLEQASAARVLANAVEQRHMALAELTTRSDELTRLQTELVGRRQGLSGSIGVLETAISGRAGRLAEAAGSFPSVAEHRDFLMTTAGALDDWAGAADDRDRATAARRRADQELAKAVADAGFASLAEAREAARLNVASARATIQAHEQRVVVLRTRMADPDLAHADPEGRREDLDAERAGVAEAHTIERVAAAAASAAASRCLQVRLAVERVVQASMDAAPVIARATWMSALADTIAGYGQNHRALSLRSYVLAARLRQVAEVASHRLRRMSEGRYEFVHSEGKDVGKRSGGLGLDILDAYTGAVRPTKTLSGGESFLASLALALGLADVVAAESGARMLDTIIIDEGFGSLDSETLELVMATLDDLRAGGRVVGIVSHVDELRQRIPSRLRVRKGVTGSTIEVTAPNLLA